MLAAAHSPHPWPSHVKVPMSPLPPRKLPLFGFYCFGFCCSHFTSGCNFHFSVWVAGEVERQRKERSRSRGGVALPLACSAFPAPSAPPPLHCLYPPWLQGLLLTPLDQHVCLSIRGISWLTPLALTPCPACVALGRSCAVSLVTFSHVPHLLHRILEASLHFFHHLSHLCGPYVTRAQQELVAWLIGFPGQASVISQPQSDPSFECLPWSPSLRRQRPDTSAAAPTVGCSFW